MDRRTKVELFESIRSEQRFGKAPGIRALARQFGVHRRLVRQALAAALPPPRKSGIWPRPRLEPVIDFIDAILTADVEAPRKQRHTARRIWVRLRQERPECVVAEVTVRRYVRRRKHELGLAKREVYIPQSYELGQEAQVDWYEAWLDCDGERVKRQVFSMRSMSSGAAFHFSYERATQQAFFEAHERAFAYFGGVFRCLRYDNLASAVRKILRGYEREQTIRFIAFRSHWGFEASFCSPAKGNEKGGIEGEVGYFRRNHLVPVPSVASVEAFNDLLLAGCRADQERRLPGRGMSVGEGLVLERPCLTPLAAQGFPLEESCAGTVDAKGCVKVKGNWYSVPLPAGTRVEARIGPADVDLNHEGRRVARHARCYDHGRQILDLEHYLEALERKPGALAGSTPLKQWREQGRWPVAFDRLWRSFERRSGKAAGTRAMIDLLQLGRIRGQEQLRLAVEQALELGCTDPAAVRHLLESGALRHSAPTLAEVGTLARFQRPLPDLAGYDALLTAPEAQ